MTDRTLIEVECDKCGDVVLLPPGGPPQWLCETCGATIERPIHVMTEAEAKALSDTANPNRPTIEAKACPPPRGSHYMRKNIVKYCRIHAAKAADCSRHVDAEVFSLAGQEIERLQAERESNPPQTRHPDIEELFGDE